MSELERDLRESLRRRDPPPGFAERILSRAGESKARERLRAARRPVWRWATAAAMAVVMVAGFAIYQEQRRRAEQERAMEQLMFALRLTGSHVRYLQERLAEVQQRRIEIVGGTVEHREN
jgi:anti-sigma-K factor RskA